MLVAILVGLAAVQEMPKSTFILSSCLPVSVSLAAPIGVSARAVIPTLCALVYPPQCTSISRLRSVLANIALPTPCLFFQITPSSSKSVGRGSLAYSHLVPLIGSSDTLLLLLYAFFAVLSLCLCKFCFIRFHCYCRGFLCVCVCVLRSAPSYRRFASGTPPSGHVWRCLCLSSSLWIR